jgi:hypothetical protein
MPERIYWKQISGPAKVWFSDIADPHALVKFPQAGEYVLQFGTDSVTLSVLAPLR